MLKTIFKTIGATLLIAYLAVAGFIWNIGTPDRTFKQDKDIRQCVKVVICDSAELFLNDKDIYPIVCQDSLDPRGKLIDQYNCQRLKAALMRNTLIERADCYPTPDSLLRIDIYQRHPILRVKSQLLSNDYYVDVNGEMMRYRKSNKAVNVMLATGHITKEMATTGLFDLVRFINGHRRWRDEFTQIYVEPNGDVRLVPRKGDHTVLLGPVSDLDSKFARLYTFQKKVLDVKGWNSYKTLSLKYKGQVVAEKY
ncbi:MAG: hypothetical protein KBT20_01900 [Bacteroidales bacterium]|nr:hypothetical protein [Candidatus Liminaster caballi]